MCPDLSAINFGSWKCKGQTDSGVEDGGMCAAICNDGFKFGFANAKYGVYHCQCVDGDDCRWKQPHGIVAKAKKLKPDLVTAVSSLAWDTTFIFGESIIPTCSFIEHKPDKVCSKVPEIQNGFFRCSKGHANGSGCILTCNQGSLINYSEIYLVKAEFKVNLDLKSKIFDKLMNFQKVLLQLGIKDLDQKSNVASEKAVGLRHDSKKYFILCAALCSYDKTATK